MPKNAGRHQASTDTVRHFEMTQFVIPPKPVLKKRKTPPRKTQYAIMPLRALTDKRITDRNRTVLAMMSSFANRAGITWVTQKRIGEEFKVTPQAIQRMLGKLRDCGYIEKVSGYKGRNILLEIKKDEKAKLSPDQEIWHKMWRERSPNCTCQ